MSHPDVISGLVTKRLLDYSTLFYPSQFLYKSKKIIRRYHKWQGQTTEAASHDVVHETNASAPSAAEIKLNQ